MSRVVCRVHYSPWEGEEDDFQVRTLASVNMEHVRRVLPGFYILKYRDDNILVTLVWWDQ